MNDEACSDHQGEVQALVDAAKRSIDARRVNGGSASGITFTPVQPAAASHLDDSDAIAVAYASRRRDEEERSMDELEARMEAEAMAAKAAELNPEPGSAPNDRNGPKMCGDAAAVATCTRAELMRIASLHTFVPPEEDLLACSGEDGDAKLPALGIDFGYDPESETWISEKEDTEN